MKQKYGKSLIAVPIGLCWSSVVMTISHFKPMPDITLGILMGLGIGFMATPIILKKLKPTSC
jgi:hypothetical protein